MLPGFFLQKLDALTKNQVKKCTLFLQPMSDNGHF